MKSSSWNPFWLAATQRSTRNLILRMVRIRWAAFCPMLTPTDWRYMITVATVAFFEGSKQKMNRSQASALVKHVRKNLDSSLCCLNVATSTDFEQNDLCVFTYMTQRNDDNLEAWRNSRPCALQPSLSYHLCHFSWAEKQYPIFKSIADVSSSN